MKRSFAVGMGLAVWLALGAGNGPRAVVQAAGQATTQAKPAPTVDEILERAIRASGGREAWKRLTSVRMKGRAEIVGMDAPGTFEILAKAPNKVLQTITLGPTVLKQGSDGQQGWKELPGQGVQDMTGGELSQFKRDSEFYGELKFRELYSQITYLGEEDVNNRPAYVLRAVPADGAARKFYFDKASGLRVRMDDEEGAEENPPAQSYFEDYKEVAGTGVKMPATVRIVTPAMSVVVRLEEMAANVAIDDAVFAKPAAETTGASSADEQKTE